MLNVFYQKIQVIMTILGYYDGACDGVWGPKCVEAKRKWEMADEFEPGVPSNGLPFNGRGRLPKGMNYAFKGLDIIWDKWDATRAEQILAEKGELLTPAMVLAHVMGSTTAEVAPKAAEPVAVMSTLQAAPLAASIVDTQNVQTARADADGQDEEVEDKTETKKPNWTKNKGN